MVLRVSAASSKEVAALVSAMKLLPRDVASEIRRHTRESINPIVRESLNAHAVTALQVKGIANTTRVKISDQNITVQAGAVRGGFKRLDPRLAIRSLEFGSNGGRVATYDRRSPKGTMHKVTRHTMRQFGRATKGGKTFYPAVRDMAPRAVALMIQTALRTIHDRIERS